MPIGINKSRAGLGGQIPQYNLTGYSQLREKRLYKSRREVALISDMNVKGGYGQLERGTVMAVSSDDATVLVPYVTDDPVTNASPGAVFLVADTANASDEVRVALNESYMFQPGDAVILNSATAAMLVREVDSVDRTGNVAVITLTAAVDDDYNIANDAYIFIRCGDDGDDYSLAACVLDSDIYTGVDEGNSNGALAPILLSNAMIYQDAVIGMDASARTDMGNVFAFGGIYWVLR